MQSILLNQDSGSGDAAGSGDWVAAAALKQMMQYRVKMTIRAFAEIRSCRRSTLWISDRPEGYHTSGRRLRR